MFVVFDKWKSTADEITGLDGLRIQAHCLIAYLSQSYSTSASYSFKSSDIVGVCYYNIIILWLVLFGNGAFMNNGKPF